MNSTKPFRIHSRIKSVGFAIEGIVTFFKTQHNAWIHSVSAIGVVIGGFILDVNYTEWCLLAITIALVIIAEMLNTAIEFLTDMVSPAIHPQAKKVKDVAAGAVLFTAITAVIIGGIIFIPKILILF